MVHVYQRRIKKAKQKNEENNEHQTCFDHLPQEISIDILSRLPVTSIIQFSFVSRSFNSLPHYPFLVDMHLSRSSTNESSYLIFHSDYPLNNQIHFLRFTDQKVRKIDIPFACSMPEFNIIGSCDGVLCLVDSSVSNSIYLYNPFTRNYRELPENSLYKHRSFVYGFGYDPITDDWKVIKIGFCRNLSYSESASHIRKVRRNLKNRQISEVQLYSLSSNTWTFRGFLTYGLEEWSSPGVLVNGRLHWVSRWGKYNVQLDLDRVIVAYDLAYNSFQEIKKPSASAGKWASCHLVNLDGCLSAAVPMSQGRPVIEIWVMKEYGSDESWVKGYTIEAYYSIRMMVDRGERSRYCLRRLYGGKSLRVLCMMENGDLLLEYRGGGLLYFDPCTGLFKEWRFEGSPRRYRTTIHFGSLI